MVPVTSGSYPIEGLDTATAIELLRQIGRGSRDRNDAQRARVCLPTPYRPSRGTTITCALVVAELVCDPLSDDCLLFTGPMRAHCPSVKMPSRRYDRLVLSETAAEPILSTPHGQVTLKLSPMKQRSASNFEEMTLPSWR